MAKKPEAGIEVGEPRDGATGLKPGQVAVRSNTVKDLQAVALMREMVLNGGDVKLAAKKFNLSTATARARLSYGQRAQLFVQHEDTLLTGIVPKAEAVIMEFLDRQVATRPDGTPILNPETNEPYLLPYSKDQANLAQNVFKGVGLFRKPGTTAPAAAEVTGKGGATLEDHIKMLRQKAAELNGETPMPEEAIDVEYSYLVEQKQLAQAVETPCEADSTPSPAAESATSDVPPTSTSAGPGTSESCETTPTAISTSSEPGTSTEKETSSLPPMSTVQEPTPSV